MTPNEFTCTVYMHINKLNNMKYVGCTSQPPSLRWANGRGYARGQSKFYGAIQEFGWDNFEHIIVESNMSQENAWALEEKLIKEYDTINNGYNSTYGGKYNYPSETVKLKLRNRKLSPETKQRISISKMGERNPNYGKHPWCYGKKMSAESRQKMSDANTPERREKNRERHLGANNPQAKAVLCIDNGKVYDTIVDASKDTGVSERTISDCCNGKTKCPRVKFKFYKEGDENVSA